MDAGAQPGVLGLAMEMETVEAVSTFVCGVRHGAAVNKNGPDRPGAPVP